MITRAELAEIGIFTKTHGIKGELSATMSIEPAYLEEHHIFICDMDGIYVPFFIESLRTKGTSSVLLKPENVDSEQQAKLFCGKSIYTIKRDLLAYQDQEGDPESEGAYADELSGYTVVDTTHGTLGVVTGIEDSTANLLLIVRTPADKTLYIPVAEPFINNIDPNEQILSVTLPEGLITLNE